MAVLLGDPDLDNEDERRSYLLDSARSGDSEGVAKAIEAGADVDVHLDVARGLEGTALVAAAANGREEVAGVLIQAGADVNALLSQESGGGRDGGSALTEAAHGGHKGVAVALIEAGADIDRPLPDSVAGANASLSDVTPLMIASFRGHEEVVRLLLGAGADVDYKVSRRLLSGERVNRKTAGMTARKFAQRGKHRALARFLREVGAGG